MPETKSNVELAHELSHDHEAAHKRRGTWLGFAEAIVLATVAVATAWSGYQASRWEALSAKEYALDERYAVAAQDKSSRAGQEQLYDSVTFNGWVAAKVAGHGDLAAFYERRFRPEYAKAFKAWMRMDPLHNKAAPPGPAFLPQYSSAAEAESHRLAEASAAHFDTGVVAREHGDDYVRVTVFLATVLFLTALSQRFEFAGPRAVVIVIAALFLVASLYFVLTLPRI
ncbi:MAG TPA: hypothetical protein VMU38_02015 [Candidatus Binatia bacterium]|nr:hypothetical protein [Candidatus Binatia bacterium]